MVSINAIWLLWLSRIVLLTVVFELRSPAYPPVSSSVVIGTY